METGAVIAAAGMSTRMGRFKPLLSIGGSTIICRVIDTLRAGGAEQIVVVTGHQAQRLEAHLSGQGVTCLRNQAYAGTHMFDSAKIGLSYLRSKCRRILFTPADVPMFTADTVKRLLEVDGEILRPVCNGQPGHPLLLSSHAVELLVRDGGENGLQGAVLRSGLPVIDVPVQDPGILYDADTPGDYCRLLKL